MKKILVIVDVQNDFVDGVLGSKESIEIIENVVYVINNSDDSYIIVTFDTHLDNYLETSEGKKLPIPHTLKGSYGWMLNDKVKKALSTKNYITIEKNTFASTKLVDEIKKIKKDDENIEIVFVGLKIDICVISNVLLTKAYFPEAKIIVYANCCAGVTHESYEAAITILKMCQIDVIGE